MSDIKHYAFVVCLLVVGSVLLLIGWIMVVAPYGGRSLRSRAVSSAQSVSRRGYWVVAWHLFQGRRVYMRPILCSWLFSFVH
jgi:hypothetical protein